MARKAYQPLQDRTQVTPAAAPVNSYIEPARPAESNTFLDLADGLSKINPEIRSIVAEQKARRDKEAADYATALAVKNDNLGVGIEEAMRDGTLSPDQYQLYTKTANVLSGNRAAIEQREGVAKSLADPASEFYTSDLETLLTQKRQEFFSGLNPLQADGANDEWQRTESMIRAARREVDASNLITGVKADYSVLARDLIRKSVLAGASSDQTMRAVQDNVSLPASALHGVPNAEKNQMLFTEILTLADEAATAGDFQLAKSYLDVARAPRVDALDPSKVLPPLATGAYGAQLANVEQALAARERVVTDRLYNQQQVTAIYDQAAVATQAGKLYMVQDQTYTKADGSSATVSAQTIKDTIIQDYLKESQATAQRLKETPEQTFTREVTWFSTQGVQNPIWKAELQSGYGSLTTATFDTGVAPANAKSAFNLYRSLYSQSPTLLAGMLDEKAQRFYEAADLAHSYLRQSEDTALASAFRVINNPAGRTVPAALVTEKLASNSSYVGENTGTLTGLTSQLANTLYAMGFDENSAVTTAVERIRRSTVVINGWSVYAGNTSIPLDFKARAEAYLDQVWSARSREFEEEGYSKEDLHIINLPGNNNTWGVQAASGGIVGQFDIKDLHNQSLNEAAALVDARNREAFIRANPPTFNNFYPNGRQPNQAVTDRYGSR